MNRGTGRSVGKKACFLNFSFVHSRGGIGKCWNSFSLFQHDSEKWAGVSFETYGGFDKEKLYKMHKISEKTEKKIKNIPKIVVDSQGDLC